VANRVIISFTLVRMLADCVGAAKYCDISIVLGIALEPMRRLHRIVASAYGIYQTQSPSLRVYVKEFMTLLVKSKSHGKAVLYPTFEGQRDRLYSPDETTLMALKSDRHDLTNRVIHDGLCGWGLHFPKNRSFSVRQESLA
jgi:hypothetical protein